MRRTLSRWARKNRPASKVHIFAALNIAQLLRRQIGERPEIHARDLRMREGIHAALPSEGR
jgi:hypothetical protein